MRARHILAPLLLWLLVLTPALGDTDTSFAGRWDSTFGVLDLKQQDSEVRGTYSCCQGNITGNVVGGLLRFVWQDQLYGQGWGEFRLRPDGSGLEGVWGKYGDANPSGRWDARRQAAAARQSSGERSTWRFRDEGQVTPQASGLGVLIAEGEAELFTQSGEVTGRLAGRAFAQDLGPAYSTEVFNELKGRDDGKTLVLDWHNPIDGSFGMMVLERKGGMLIGSWSTADRTSKGTISFQPIPELSAAIDLARPLERQERLARARQLREQASELSRRAQFDEAFRSLAEAAEIYRLEGDRNRLGETLHAIAWAHTRRGDYEDALALYEEILALEGINEDLRVTTEDALEMLRMELGQGVQPNSYEAPAADPQTDLQEAKWEARQLLSAGDNDGAIVAVRRALRQLSSEFFLGKADEELGRNGRLIDLVSLLQVAFYAHSRNGDPAAALRRVQQELRLLRQMGSLGETGEPQALERQAQAELAMNEPAAAEASLREALAIQERRQAPDTFRTHAELAGLLAAGGRFAEAEEQFKAAISKVEDLRGRMRQETTKLGFLGGQNVLMSPATPYFAYVAFLMERRPDPEAPLRALLVTERLRARATLDRLAALETASPVEAGLAEAIQVEPIDIGELKPLVRASGSAYLAWFVTPAVTYAWLISPDGQMLDFHLDQGQEEVAELVGQVRERVRSSDVRRAISPVFQKLMTPLAGALKALPPRTPLTVIPHDALHLMPFTLLLDGSQDRALDFALAYLPALSFLKYQDAPKPAPTDRLLIVAQPAGVEGLTEALAEGQAAAAHFPERSTLLSGTGATRAATLGALADYEIVLLATHGRTSGPDAPYLELAEGERLRPSDLGSVPPRPRKLAILSACETHVEPASDEVALVPAGDELMSLARAFLVAGYEAALVTLWKAEDVTASQVVPAFLARWQEGLSPPAALNAALAPLRQGSTSAFAWAPWVLIGRHG